jgi:UDP-glucose 4-epimerase
MPGQRFIIIGGAGFIGSHFCDRLLGAEAAEKVIVFDNFTSGKEWHVEQHKSDSRFSIVRGDVRDLDLLTDAMTGSDVAIHLASNPDIAKAATQPDVDFYEGTALTNNVVEAMRLGGVKSILYASGSGVYGDTGPVSADEEYRPLQPISTYGASKLAGEALISAYAYMFDIRGLCFRFGNVVGSRQTHGVGFDFARRLMANPSRLRILGDGLQSKSYIHIDDVVAAVLHAHHYATGRFNVYNVATGDYVTVREIADLACEAVGIDPATVSYEFSGGDRGWKGDVPIVRLDTEKIRALGWRGAAPTRVALRRSLVALRDEVAGGRI